MISGSPTASLGTINAGDQVEIAWKVLCTSDLIGESISVKAWGMISGAVPEARWEGESVYYPAYDYIDAIGGETTVYLQDL